HVDDDGVRDRLLIFLPRPEALVLALGHDDRGARVVHTRGDAATQGLLVGALEVSQGLGPDTPDAGVAILGADDLALALVLDVGELQLLAQDVGELVEGDVDLQDVLALALARLPRARLVAFLSSDRISSLPVPLPHPALLLRPEGEARDLDVGDRDGDQILAFTTNHLPVGGVLAQVLADAAPHDGGEPRGIAVNRQRQVLVPCYRTLLPIRQPSRGLRWTVAAPAQVDYPFLG